MSIEQEIEEMAEKMIKSEQDPKETLFKTINALGKNGIKARLPLLSNEEKLVLKAALEEMNLKKSKSVEFDKEAQGAKHIQGNIMDTVIQEEKGDDEADEKLVKPEAAKHNHQGNSTEGWEGQVIKGGEAFKKLKNELSHEKGVTNPAGLAAKIGREKMGKEAFDRKAAEGRKKSEVKKADKNPVEPGKDMESEEKQQVKAAEKVGKYREGQTMKKSFNELYAEANELKKAEKMIVKAMCEGCKRGMKMDEMADKLEKKGMPAKRVKKCMKKAMKKMGKDEASKKIMEMEEKEHGTKDPKELVEREKKEHKAEKELESVKKSDSEHDKGRILEEEKQLGDTDQMTEESKDLGDESQDPAKANKQAQKDVNNMKVGEQIKKSVSWNDDNALLKARTGGRNFTFNVGSFVEEMLKSETTPTTEIKKSEIEKQDINDLIEKGQDQSWGQYDLQKSLEVEKTSQDGKLVKSFEDNEIAKLLGLTEEEAKKILG